MFKLKTPLIIAGAMCLLSMLIGIINGVRFFNILLRGIIAGIGAGCFVFFARSLLEKFIPDLFVPSPSSDAAEPVEITSGANVNITLDDDSDKAAVPRRGGAAVSGAETVQDAESGGYEHNASMAEAAGNTEQTDSGSTVSGETPHFQDSPAISLEDSPQEGGTALSDLPDMGSFMDDSEDSDDESVNSDGSSNFSVNNLQTGGSDSKVMAQAIRTILAAED